jgi:YhcH/YjgK/YiaL family protein
MSMLGKVEDLIAQVAPTNRLHRGLLLLRDYQQGRSPEISLLLSRQKPGDVARLPVDGDALYLLVQTYQARSREQGRFEAHQHHTDLQYLCEGREWVECCDLHARPNLPAYDGKGNLYFPLGTETHSRLFLEAGNVAVLFPNDAHAPCLRVEDSPDQLVRKIVVKVMDADPAR